MPTESCISKMAQFFPNEKFDRLQTLCGPIVHNSHKFYKNLAKFYCNRATRLDKSRLFATHDSVGTFNYMLIICVVRIADNFGFGQYLANYFRQKHAKNEVSTTENKNFVGESINRNDEATIRTPAMTV